MEPDEAGLCLPGAPIINAIFIRANKRDWGAVKDGK
jgi:hypothetical protein